MADPDRWRSWDAPSDLDARGIALPDVRARVVAFLNVLVAAVDALTATLAEVSEDDLIAVLGLFVLVLPGPDQARTSPALFAPVDRRLLVALEGPDPPPAAAARMHTWLMTVTQAVEAKSPTLRWAIVAVFLRRVLRARLTGPEPEDGEALDHAATTLSAVMTDLLHDVGSGTIPPETYHVM